MKTLSGFHDDADRLTADAIVQVGGELRLCVLTGTGYTLYSRAEWEAGTAADYEADSAGEISRLGRPIGQRLLQSAMDAAVS